MIFLVDHHLEGQAKLLLGTLEADGWLELLLVRLLTLADAGLAANTNDRAIWRFVQTNGMLLVTGNRNMRGPDSLGQTIRDENTPGHFPCSLSAASSDWTNRSTVGAAAPG